MKFEAGVLFSISISCLALVAAADFVVTMNHPVLSGFIDPLLAPGKSSAHLHNIFGSSSITENTKTAAQLKNSICTNANILSDRSSYWVSTVCNIIERIHNSFVDSSSVYD
jgi:hypothetical protein